MKMVIYKITNTTNSKSYIGKSVKALSTRWYNHKLKANNNSIDTHFARALRKYPEEVWLVEVLFVAFNKEYLSDIEKLLIAEYDTFHNGYNMTAGGEGGDTSSSMNYINGIKNRRDYSGKNNPNHGGTHTEEARNRISIARKGTIRDVSSIEKGKASLRNTLDNMDVHYNAKSWSFVNPQGEIISFDNLCEFCRDNDLNQSAMGKVYNCTQKSHKGYVANI